MKIFGYYVILSTILCFDIISGFPSDIKQCKIGDNICIASTITEILHNGANGKADLGLPTLKPYKVKKLIVSESQSGALALDLTFNDVNFYGLTDAVVNRIEGFESDPNKSKFEIYGVIPKLELKANYITNGRILILPIQGEGDANIVGTDVKISIKFKPSVTTKDNKTFLENVKVKVLLEPAKLQMHLENLFNGDKALGENMNRFLNENWSDVWTELAPNVNSAIAGVVTDILTQVFKKISYDDFYLN